MTGFRKMKKVHLATALAVIAMATGASADLAVTWGAVESGGFLYNDAGVQLTGAGGYLIQLILDLNNNTQLGGAGGMIESRQFGVGAESDFGGLYDSFASDDIVVASGLWQVGSNTDNYLAGNPVVPVIDIFSEYVTDDISDSYGSRSFYFRWFDSDSIMTATEVGILYGTGWATAANSTAPQPQVDFTYGGSGNPLGTAYTAGPNDGWQTIAPIPEPGTIGLFLIGAGVLAYRKRRTA